MKRLYGLDLLRAILIIEGVFYHVGLIVSPLSWIYSSKVYNSYFLGIVFQFFHIFRMETFFILSGFFSTLVIFYKGLDYFKDTKLNRLFVPFIVLLLIIALPQSLYIYNINGGEYSYPFLISHMWFLETLIYISILHYFICIKSLKVDIYLIIFFAILYFLSNPLSGIIGKFVSKEISFSINNFFTFSFYYFFGVFFYNNKERVIIFLKNYFIPILIVTSLSVIIYLFEIFNNYLSTDQYHYEKFLRNLSFFDKYLYLYIKMPILKLIAALGISIMLIYTFIQLEFRKNNFVNKIVEAALPIYIFHHPLVIFFGNLFDNKGLNIYLYFSLVVLTSLSLSIALYFLFNKNIFFRKAFGLKVRN